MKRTFTLFLSLFIFSAVQLRAQTSLRFGTDFVSAVSSSYTFTSNDKVHTVDGTQFATSTSNICGGADRRTQVNSIIIELVSTSASSITLHGNSSGSTSARTISKVEVATSLTGTYTTVSDATTPANFTSNIVGSTCGTSTALNLNIPSGRFVKLSFTTDLAGTSLQNVRVSGFDISPATLPVRYGAISANFSNGFVRVNWDVLSEVNTDKYYIEKSADGKNFTAVGSLAARNLSKYSFVDNAVISNAATFYRLKAVDKDGTLSYSNIVRVNTGKSKSDVVIAPNPVQNGSLNVQLSDITKSAYTFNLFTADGKKVFTQTLSLEAGSTTQNFTLPSSIVKGIYNLQVVNSSGLVANKAVIVQ